MTRYLVDRLLYLIPVLVGISLAVFLVMRIVPGDAAVAMLGEQANPTRLAQVREDLGLDKPLLIQYFEYMRGVLTGDLGRSVLNNRSVTAELMVRFPATIELALTSIMIGIIVGIPVGIIAAIRRGSTLDAFTMSLSLVGVSMPIFWLGLILIWLFAIVIGWFPVSGRLSADQSLTKITHFYVLDALLTWNIPAFFDSLWHLILPAVTLATIPMAETARMTRSSVLEVLSEDYVRTARSKGASEGSIILRHVLRNASIPIITLLGLQLGRLLGGAVVTETIFSWPGLGRYVLDGVLGRDYPVVQGTVLLITLIFTIANLGVDISYGVLDPRIRLRRA